MKKNIFLDKNAEKELRKKTQKTPIKNLELAQRRFKLYEFH